MSTNEEEGFSTIVFNAVMCFFLGGLALMWGLDDIYSTLGHVNPFGYFDCGGLVTLAYAIILCLKA